MSRPDNANSPTVLLVGEDRALLRHLSRFLNTFGYDVRQVAETQRAQVLLAAASPQVMIVDGGQDHRKALDFCRAVSGSNREGYTHIVLMAGAADLDMAEALEAGVDDFLARPVVYGELLARLRSGVRAWQFEDRARRQRRVDPITGLPSAAEFFERVRESLSGDAGGMPAACVVLGLDFIRQITAAHGETIGREAVQQVGGILREACGETVFLAALGGDQFGCLLAGMDDCEAAAWAEKVRRRIAEEAMDLPGGRMSLSASFGVAGKRAPAGPPDLWIERVRDALRRAGQSGGNCVVRDGEFAEEDHAWAELAAPGKLFERTTARDVMTPCCLVLGKGEAAAPAMELINRTGVDVLAVVDQEGRYAGAIAAEEALDRLAGAEPSLRTVAELTSRAVPSFDEETPFLELLEFFARGGGTAAVIVENGKPVGYVTAASLAELTTAPHLAIGVLPRFGSCFLRCRETEIDTLRPVELTTGE
ncbi:MAG: diguanylate cyclase [Pirellulales bacterium]|nr:diguanylate cyclase [Pirellulales bacterium]